MLRAVSLLVGLAIAGGLAWWLFGWRSHDNPALGRIVDQRFFGRYTKVRADTNRDGRADMVMFYSFSQPYDGIVDGPCGGGFVSTAEDRNFDARWDTWSRSAASSTDGLCPDHVFEADTDADGEPDLTKAVAPGRSLEFYAHLKSIRGY